MLANQIGVNTDPEVSDLPCPLWGCTLITRRSDCSYSVREKSSAALSLRNRLKLRDNFNSRADTANVNHMLCCQETSGINCLIMSRIKHNMKSRGELFLSGLMSRIYNHSMILYAEILSVGQCLCFIRDEGKLTANVKKSGASLKVR